jgi:hypothetical protein
VSLVRHTPDPGTWYLQLSFWEDAAQDPAGLDMASRVMRLLSGPGDRDAAAGSSPAPARAHVAAGSGIGTVTVNRIGADHARAGQ